MTDKNLVILGEPPAAFIAGSDTAYGNINLITLIDALDRAGTAFRNAEEVAASPDTIESLRRDLNALSDAVRSLAGEVLQIGAGVRHGRIAVTGIEH